MVVQPSSSSFAARQRKRLTPATSFGSSSARRTSPVSKRRSTLDWTDSLSESTTSFTTRYAKPDKTSTKRSLVSLALPLVMCSKSFPGAVSSRAPGASGSGRSCCGQRPWKDFTKVTKLALSALPPIPRSSSSKSCSLDFSSSCINLQATAATQKRNLSSCAQTLRSMRFNASVYTSTKVRSDLRALVTLSLASASSASQKFRTFQSSLVSTSATCVKDVSAFLSASIAGFTSDSTSLAVARTSTGGSVSMACGESFAAATSALARPSSAVPKASLTLTKAPRMTSMVSSRCFAKRSASSLAAFSRSLAFTTDFSMATMERICWNRLNGIPAEASASVLASLLKILLSCSSLSSNPYSSKAKMQSS
mmetsp:Transcript_40707/g.94384  ORF Transcript_40707/g.94384 Transcript_40707/m.94384 type:complete len:366 (-) Transcript_40707:2-1099(-)